eukprot:m.266974 g.266974  ORF g.266974 m.266974 type:complete len:465 (+) comp19722_c2_seq31:935-2329(+)
MGASLPIIGSPDLLAVAESDVFAFHGFQDIPLAIASAPATVATKHGTVSALDVYAGTVKMLTPLAFEQDASIQDADTCVTMEETWYAHRQHPGVIVRDVYFTNRLHRAVTIGMPTVADGFVADPEGVAHDWARLPADNFTMDSSRGKLDMRAMVVDEGTGTRVGIVYTKTLMNFTLQPRMSIRKLLVLCAVKADSASALVSAMQRAIDLVGGETESTRLLKAHEYAWSRMWPVRMRMMPHDAPSHSATSAMGSRLGHSRATGRDTAPGLPSYAPRTSAFFAALYYLVSTGAGVPDLDHASADGCFAGEPLRGEHASLPELPYHQDMVRTHCRGAPHPTLTHSSHTTHPPPHHSPTIANYLAAPGIPLEGSCTQRMALNHPPTALWALGMTMHAHCATGRVVCHRVGSAAPQAGLSHAVRIRRRVPGRISRRWRQRGWRFGAHNGRAVANPLHDLRVPGRARVSG